jgi:hypothetical protein
MGGLGFSSGSSLEAILVAILALGGLGWLGWISVQSLRQAALLRSLPRGNAGALEGSWLAIHGTVTVRTPLDVPGIGPCLWCRIIERELDSVGWRLASRRSRWRTISDRSLMATFTISAGAQEVEVAAPPTEVQDSRARVDSDSPDLVGTFCCEGSYTLEYEWLPVVPEATVIGRIERRGDARVVVADPQLGLLLSPNPPDAAARIEQSKGVAGLLAVAAGLTFLFWLLMHAGTP